MVDANVRHSDHVIPSPLISRAAAEVHMQRSTCRGAHAEVHMQRSTCTGPHAEVRMQRSTCRGPHAEVHMQRSTCRGPHLEVIRKPRPRPAKTGAASDAALSGGALKVAKTRTRERARCSHTSAAPRTPGGKAKKAPERPRTTRKSPKSPGRARRAPEGPRRPQTAPEGPRRPRKAPDGPRLPRRAPENPREAQRLVVRPFVLKQKRC